MSQAVITGMVAKKLAQLRAAHRELEKAVGPARLVIAARIDQLLDEYHRMITPPD